MTLLYATVGQVALVALVCFLLVGARNQCRDWGWTPANFAIGMFGGLCMYIPSFLIAAVALGAAVWVVYAVMWLWALATFIF